MRTSVLAAASVAVLLAGTAAASAPHAVSMPGMNRIGMSPAGQARPNIIYANEKAAFDYFVGQGLSTKQSAGVIGNLDQESSVDPNSHQIGGGPGRGIAQWSVGGRWDTDSNDNVLWYASKQGESSTSLSLQLDFVWYELTTFSGYGLGDLEDATSIDAAVVAFQDDYEGCGTCDTSTRESYAQAAYDKYKDDTPAPSIVSGSSAVVVGSTYHVFWTRSDGHVMQSLYSGSGWHVQDLGGTLVGSPAVLYHRSGSTDRYDVFGVSPSNKKLYQDTYSTGGSWSGWHAVGGAWAPGVSGVYVGGVYHVFGHSPSGHVFQYFYDGSWHSQDLGGVTSGTPAVLYHASGSTGRYDLFSVSPGGGLYQDTYTTGGSWSGWHQVVPGASFAPGAAGVFAANGVYHVFARSKASNAMAQVFYDGAWKGPQNLGGTFTGGPGLTYQHGSGSDRYDLFGPGTNPDHIYQSTYTSGGHWSTWHAIS